jgi:hypothetical protein
MDRISFDIFEPEEKKFRLTPNFIVYSLWFSAIDLFWIMDGVLPIIKEIRLYVACGIFLISIYYLITSFFNYEPLKGVLKGKIVFNNDAIIINEKVYDLKSIRDIDFGFLNFFGELSTGWRGNFNPLLSQGVSNFIKFTDSDNQPVQVYFRIQGRHGSQALYPFINEAVKLGAMTYYRAIDLIDVENVTKPIS